MKIITSLDAVSELEPHAFTIGTFDGVHQGHKALFEQLKATGRPTALLTFSTHPLQTLCPEKPISLITPLQVKLALLEQAGLDTVLVVPFSRAFADLSFDQLLERLPMSHLVLGKQAVFGYRREGTERNVCAWARDQGIETSYIEKTKVGREAISSRRIRDAIKQGDLAFAEQLLGHPHFVYIPANTTRVCVAGLCMPPNGQYRLCLGMDVRLDGGFMELNRPISEPAIASIISMTQQAPNTPLPLRGSYVI